LYLFITFNLHLYPFFGYVVYVESLLLLLIFLNSFVSRIFSLRKWYVMCFEELIPSICICILFFGFVVYVESILLVLNVFNAFVSFFDYVS